MLIQVLLKIYKETTSFELCLNTLRSIHLNNSLEKVLPTNSSRTLDNVSSTSDNYNNKFWSRTMEDFSFTKFLIDRVLRCSKNGVSYCYFCKAVSKNYFNTVLLKNFICTYANCIKDFNFALFLLIWKLFSPKRVTHCSFHRVVQQFA